MIGHYKRGADLSYPRPPACRRRAGGGRKECVGRPVCCPSSAPPTQGRRGPLGFAGRPLQTAEVLRKLRACCPNPERSGIGFNRWCGDQPLPSRAVCCGFAPAASPLDLGNTPLRPDPEPRDPEPCLGVRSPGRRDHRPGGPMGPVRPIRPIEPRPRHALEACPQYTSSEECPGGWGRVGRNLHGTSAGPACEYRPPEYDDDRVSDDGRAQHAGNGTVADHAGCADENFRGQPKHDVEHGKSRKEAGG